MLDKCEMSWMRLPVEVLVVMRQRKLSRRRVLVHMAAEMITDLLGFLKADLQVFNSNGALWTDVGSILHSQLTHSV